MSRPFFHSPPTRWSELYKDWLAYAEATNEERKNGWKKLSTLERVLCGENRVGILAEIKTCTRATVYYSDGEWKNTTTVIKLIKEH